MKFRVIDKLTGKEADPYEIALHEEWAKELCYCDMDGFALLEDGTLILVDECGKFEYCEADRFEVVFVDDRPHGKWVPGREISQMWTGDKFVAIDYEDFSCSCCGVVVEESTEPEWNFCPNCGSDNRKREGDENG